MFSPYRPPGDVPCAACSIRLCTPAYPRSCPNKARHTGRLAWISTNMYTQLQPHRPRPYHTPAVYRSPRTQLLPVSLIRYAHVPRYHVYQTAHVHLTHAPYVEPLLTICTPMLRPS